MEEATAAPSLRLIHLSDLHFGAQTDGTIGALREALRALQPSMVVVTGDLTHGGRPDQFRTARNFLDSLQVPWVAMPGNHDLPLTPWRRFIDPLREYRRNVASHTAPRVDAELMRFAAIDSTDPAAWRAGKVSLSQAEEASNYLAAAKPPQIRVVAAHHPFSELKSDGREGMHGASEALKKLCCEGEVDLVLAGHLHCTRIGIMHPDGLRCMVGCVASTPTSPRCEASGEAFVCVDLREDAITLSPWRRTPEAERFRRVKGRHFTRQRDNHWRELEPDFDDEEED